MPKKSKWGENPKAVVAKEKKETKKIEEQTRKQQVVEDEFWRDDDKHGKRKEDRKSEKEKKKQDSALRKAEARALFEEEEVLLAGKKAQEKVTRAQIESQQEKDRQRLAEEAKRNALESKNISEQEEFDENPNQLLRRQIMEGEGQARSVAEALELLSVAEPIKLPKKVTYADFEARELPQLKADNPRMKHSQVKQLLWKEWQKSLDNPINTPLNVQ